MYSTNKAFLTGQNKVRGWAKFLKFSKCSPLVFWNPRVGGVKRNEKNL